MSFIKKAKFLAVSGLFLLTGAHLTFAAPANNATFVTQTVPTGIEAGKTFTASITMKNTGTSAWTASSNFKLGSQSPQDNIIWGTSRILLGASEKILPGKTKRFAYTFTAPVAPGTYAFQWRMLREGVQWFGAYSPVVNITVKPKPSTLPPGVSLKTVRVIYLIPSDHAFRTDFQNGIDRAIKNVKTWYQSKTSGYTFKINSPAVEVAYSDKTASWFATNGTRDTRLNVYYNAGDEVTRLLGADYSSPDFVWVIYVDTEEGGGLGAPGLTVLPQADMLGLIGRSVENANIDRWIGGLGHELGHGLNLNHPLDTSPDYGTAVMGLGYLSYPNATLTSDDKATVLAHPLFTYQGTVATPGPTISGIEVYTYLGGAFTHSQVEPGGAWLETNDGPATYSFVETSRDTLHILLVDRSRNMKVRLPIFGGMSEWSTDGGITWYGLYTVTRELKQAPDVYTHSTGAFTHSQVESGGTWKETSTLSTSVYTFAETSRDATYVHMLDAGRGMRVRIPIAGGMSEWSLDGVTWNGLYSVIRKI